MRDQDPSFQTLDPVDCLSCSVKREIRLSYQNIAETHSGCVLLTRRTRLIQVNWKMYCFVIHRSRDIHQIPVRWYYQTGNNQNTDYKFCVGFYPALH